jgi:molybdopterin-guanine dinucleotide biosynthesis protein A
MSDVSALILAGGKATRFGGIAKHEIVIDGETIFARQIRVLAPRVAEILVSCGYDIEGYRTVKDAVEGVGPLGGIAAGLAACRTPWLLVLAGDMPYVTDQVIDRLLCGLCVSVVNPSGGSNHRDTEATEIGTDVDAIGIRVNGLPEPLVCVLRREAVLPVVERRIASGDFKASRLLTDELHVRWVELGDADRAALRNVNSPEDLRP